MNVEIKRTQKENSIKDLRENNSLHPSFKRKKIT